MSTLPKRRLHFLDSLRGLAAVYVVLFHAYLFPPYRPFLDGFTAKVMHFGGTGVFLFFVISGFSLAMTMPRHERTGKPVLSYATSRFFRIAPLFYVWSRSLSATIWCTVSRSIQRRFCST